MIIISASGMLTGGRMLHHLQAFGTDARNAILLSGFQAGSTRGAALAMPGSSALVAIIALQLKRTSLEGIRPAAASMIEDVAHLHPTGAQA